MAIIKVTEYLPNYMWMDEIHVEYDLDNKKRRVDNGEWRNMTDSEVAMVTNKYIKG
jgi:hypothetical protein